MFLLNTLMDINIKNAASVSSCDSEIKYSQWRIKR